MPLLQGQQENLREELTQKQAALARLQEDREQCSADAIAQLRSQHEAFQQSALQMRDQHQEAIRKLSEEHRAALATASKALVKSQVVMP